MKKNTMHYFKWLLVSFVLLAMTGCSTGPRLVDHSFSFRANWDSPDVYVLNYRYGNSKAPGARIEDDWLKTGQIPQGTNTNGPMLLGDELYVKWRINSTGKVFEDTVDLKGRLPSNMNLQRIHFAIKGPQLYVFLISPEKLNPNPCPSQAELSILRHSDSPPNRIFAMYCDLKITMLYPNQPKK